jgi:glycosyltransferase involved in cell wall biosynthesis
MRVVLSAIGKFHLFDLARQLHRRKALATFFTGYPRCKLAKEELPAELVDTFPWLHAPYMALPLLRRRSRLARWWEWRDLVCFDRHVTGRVPECDIFMALSGMGMRAGVRAQQLGAKYVCDRGSCHIRVQDRILREEYDRQGIRFDGIDPRVIAREEAEYAAADTITVPSTFALQSFVEMGIPRQKLHLAPYGVDLRIFHPNGAPGPREFRVLFVGNVNIEKGVPDLLEAFQRVSHPAKSLTLIGDINQDLKQLLRRYCADSRIKAIGHVPQSRLKDFLSQAHVMVLPSVQEGLALVQAQAMSCGCPVVATTNTGAEDLFTDGREGFIVPIRDPDAIADRLQRLADDTALQNAMRTAALSRIHAIQGWNEYGENMYCLFTALSGRA